MNSIRAAAVLTFMATQAYAFPAASNSTTTSYACNPAHSYPEGVQCVSTNGGLALVTPASAAASASSTGYACNPAHSYPEGVQCVSTNGGLALVTPSAAASASSTGYACNPAHSYPEGVQCVSTNGGLALVTPSASASASSTGYACNPAHSYPEGVQCVSTNGGLALVTPSASASASSTGYACNPAHSYPGGVQCVSASTGLVLVTPSVTVDTPLPLATETFGCNPAHSYPGGVQCVSASTGLVLVTPSVTVDTPLPLATESSTYLCNPAHSYPGGVSCDATSRTLIYPSTAAQASYTTEVVSTTVTYCPKATTLTVDNKVYTVTSATTLSIPVTSTITKAVSSASSYLCNPAHSYPGGVSCDGSALTLVTPAPSAPAASVPAQGAAQTTPAANGECKPSTVTVTVTVPAGGAGVTPNQGGSSAAASSSGYACNPAHSYPEGVRCVSTNGALSLVTPAASSTGAAASSTGYACNPAHSYPEGVQCVSTNGGLTLVTPTASTGAPKASSTGSFGNSSTSSTCPLVLKAGSYEYPHSLKINGVNGYNGKVDSSTKTSFTFDIPAADAGKNCNVYFTLPARNTLETSDYTLTTVDGATISVTDGKTEVAHFVPETNEAWLIASMKCPAGQQLYYEMSTSSSLSLTWFNDYNPCALGAFVTVE